MSGRALAAGVVLAASAAGAHGGVGHDAGVPPLDYELPAAGSYALPVIDRVREHRLTASDGEPAALLGLGPGEYAIVAFVYLSCTDTSGCPLSLGTLQRTDRVLAGHPELRDRVRLVTVSFDPERDSPEAMAQLRNNLAPRGEWRFLTAGSEAELRPVLEDFGQDAVPLLTADGARAGVVRHVTKVFLVDAEGGVRNVYSTGFLDHRLMLRDLETLLLSSDGGRS